jgi:Peptidase family S41/Tricorn protease C1 domain
MKTIKATGNQRRLCGPRLSVCSAIVLLALAPRAEAVELLQRYPTKLEAGDLNPESARSWNFTEADLFQLSSFSLNIAKLRIEIGPADLGVGHGKDGAVWAVVIPRQEGKLTSTVSGQAETIAHVWLRFHPKEIERLFPAGTVSSKGALTVFARMRAIASAKFGASYQAGMNAMIPEPKDMTVDVDTKEGPRRFFVVDTAAPGVEYVADFEGDRMKLPPPISAAVAEKAFDQLWQAFDRDYAMFVLRPEVDWEKLRQEYRPKALAAASAYEFAGICAEMLKPLRDLHVWLKVAGTDVPVFNRPRSANANPSATRALLGELHEAGRTVGWAVSSELVGYLVIYGWDDQEAPRQCDEALEHMGQTRGLVVDVRLNGGGSEDLAGEVAGRFLNKPFVYAYSQFRSGPRHNDLTGKMERTVSPRGPWRYSRPVVLLIGQKCMSSNESFVAMMSGDPDLTTMGDHTCGSSGNPRMVELPMDITVSVPRWIDYLPDGTALDERGFSPQLPFKPQPGAFEGQHDDLLAAALARLRQCPLSEGVKKPEPAANQNQENR